MLNVSGLEVPRTVEEAVDIHRTGLLVYDMQVGVLRQIRNSDALIGKVGELLETTRALGLRTWFVRHTSQPTNLMGRFQIRQAMAWQRTDDPERLRSWFLRDAEATQIVPELTPLATEGVFDKLSMSAFHGTPLDFALRDCDIRTVLICGVATEIGIEPTVRNAADLGYLPILLEDACGAGNAEAGERAMASMRFMRDAMFSTVAEVTGLLREGASGSQ